MSETKYQGVAIVQDDTEGPCISLYEDYAKEDFDLDIGEGKQAGNRPILGSKWLDTAVSEAAITDVADGLFHEVVNKIEA